MVLSSSSSGGNVGGTNRQDVLEREKAIGTFLAGDEMVRIVPSFELQEEELLTLNKKVGPWTAGIPTMVPLWLAILLRKRSLCRIELPHWMSIDSLKSVLTEERNPHSSFSTSLPLRYMELSHSILSSSPEQQQQQQQQPIRVLLEDITTVRMDKIRSNVHTMSNTQFISSKPMDIITVNGIASHEIQTMKPFLSKAFSHHLHLSLPPTTTTTTSTTNSTTNTNTNTTTNTTTTNNTSTRTSRIRRFRS